MIEGGLLFVGGIGIGFVLHIIYLYAYGDRGL